MSEQRPRTGYLSRLLVLVLACLTLWSPATLARAQTPPAASAAGATWRVSAANVMRLESWRYFEPRPDGGDPEYTFLADRLRIDIRRHWPGVDLLASGQYVGMAGLPSRAIGPGALGTGALYFDQGERHSASSHIYLRFANLRFTNLAPGLAVQIGRMGYTSGAESPSGVRKIEAIKRQRLDSRLVGEFEWSIYQRSFDGLRFDLTRPSWHATGVAFLPTQGGFAHAAGTTMANVLVTGGTVTSRPAPGTGSRTELQGFVWHYRDRRDVPTRPDNSGRTSPVGVRIDVATFGGTAIGAYPAAGGEVDLFAWGVAQTGGWYDDTHRASAVALEAGYQWTALPWRPWIRAGGFHASGDPDPADRRHNTFFPMLPTVRRFSQTTVYSTMNLRDLFVQLQARPRPPLGVRFDLRRLDLASPSDLWYAGSGATLARGILFGYTGRRSNGSRRLGTALEASADYTLSPHVSLNGFVGTIRGGRVVTGTFAGRRLWFMYLESVLSL